MSIMHKTFITLAALWIFLIPAETHAQDITTGLIGHWKLDETSGASIADASGNGNHGTWIDGSGNSVVEETGSGVLNQAITFDNTDDIIDLGSPALFDNMGPLTICAWVNANSLGETDAGVIFQKDGGISFQFDGTAPETGAITFFVNGGTGLKRSSSDGWATESFGNWTHYCVTWDGDFSDATSIKLYKNAKAPPSYNITQNGVSRSDDSSNNAAIGNPSTASTTRTLDGAIDDVRLYNRVLTDEDITALYQSVAGVMRYNDTHNIIEYHNGTQWIAAAPSQYTPNAVTFDGANDYLRILSDLTGAADTKLVTGAGWFKRATSSNSEIIYSNSGSGFRIRFNASDNFIVDADNLADTDILDIGSTTAFNGTDWHHYMFSIDMSDTGKRHLYIDGVDELNANIYTDDVIDVTSTAHAFGSDTGGGLMFTGDLADVWLDYGTYIDLSIPSNRAKFYNTNPVNLGTDGSRPTGSAPDVFLSGNTANWHINKGSGGGFTETGALTDATSRPGQPPYAINPVTFDGSDYMTRGGALTGEADSKQMTGSLWFKSPAIPTQEFLDSEQGAGGDMSVLLMAGGQFKIDAQNDAGATILDINSNVSTYDDDVWHHAMWSVDLSDTNKRHLYIDGVDVLNVTTYTNDFMDLTPVDWHIGQGHTGTNRVDADVADLWVDFGTYIDLSLPQNREKFLYNGVAAADLGTDGAQPTGVSPIIYLSGTTASWDTNKGTGGGFTLTGTLTDAADAPEGGPALQYCSNPGYMEGSITYNTDTDQMQFCNGTNWIAMGAPGDGGGGCSNPSGGKGDLTYNTTFNIMQYCEGDEWVGIGGHGIGSTLLSGLVGHWPLDETSGAIIADVSGNGNNGTWFDNADNDVTGETTTGIISRSLNFDGSDDRISIADSASLETITTGSGMTFSAWIKAPSLHASWAPIIQQQSDSTTFYETYGMHLNSDANDSIFVAITTTNDGFIPLDTGVDYSTYLGEWLHVVGVFDGTNLISYINGAAATSAPATGNIENTAHEHVIGAGKNSGTINEFFDGQIDDVRLYNRALNAAEVQALYEQDAPEEYPFIVVIDSTLGADGTSATEVMIPTGTGTFNYDIAWDDGSNSGTATGLTGDHTITGVSGPVTIEITGTFPHFGGDTVDHGVIDVAQWGEIAWQSMASAFRGEDALAGFTATDSPNLSSVTDMSNMFRDATVFNGNISGWDVSNITNMTGMFVGNTVFNQDIGGWNVSSVTDIGYMFDGAQAFNQDIGGWDVSNVTYMRNLFKEALAFNQDISGWDVSAVTNMQNMFENADAFNQDISGWDTSAAINMAAMFKGTDTFNQDISGWDVSTATNMIFMFENATAFNQDLSPWCVTLIGSTPTDFDTGASAWTGAPATRPQWGTCPYPSDAFVVVIDSTLGSDGTSATEVMIPTGTGTFNYDIAWDDGSNSGTATGLTGNHTITGVSGPVTIEITGTFPHFGGDTSDHGVIDVLQWGTNPWQSMESAFRSETNLTGFTASDAPDLSAVTDISFMFFDATNFNGDVSGWDVSNVTDTSSMFRFTDFFNQDISGWDVSSVTNMMNMFREADAFNQDISGWDVSAVTNMARMFDNANIFNQDISGWDVSDVSNMDRMFQNSSDFNQDLSEWCVSLIGSEPLDFDTGASSWAGGAATRPQWGTCPPPPDAFVVVIDSTLGSDGTAATEVMIPTGTGTFNYDIAWDDGSNSGTATGLTGNHTITGVSGPVTIEITGTFPHFGGDTSDHGVTDVLQWGTNPWQSMYRAFRGETNLTGFTATDAPDLSAVTEMGAMFYSAAAFNGDISSWDVSNVTGMVGTFNGANAFNADISGWDVSAVTDMGYMFQNATTFNRDLSPWCVTNIGSEPTSFDSGASSWAGGAATRPQWGTCSATTPDAFAFTDQFDVTVSTLTSSNIVQITGLAASAAVSISGDGNPEFRICSDAACSSEVQTWGNSAQTIDNNEYVQLRLTSNASDGTMNSATLDIGGVTDQWDVTTTDPDAFVIVINSTLDNDGTSSSEVMIPVGSGTFNYNMYWTDSGAGSGSATGLTGDHTITGVTPGEVTITITGTFPHLSGDSTKHGIVDVEQWGNQSWQSMNQAFRGETSLTGFSASDSPDLSAVTDMSYMFADSNFNDDISSWNVSNVQDMSYMFYEAPNFNQSLNSWNVSNVQNMSYMFRDAGSFNGNITSWTVSSVTNMAHMFRNADSFNQNIGSWNVSNVEDMSSMFSLNDGFNQNIGGWNVSSVLNMEAMFSNNDTFNQNIDGWNTSSVENMDSMFGGPGARYNQYIGSWDTSSVTTMYGMFSYNILFDQDIGGWNTSSVENMANMFYLAGDFTNGGSNSINNWDTSSVTTMSQMFNGAELFNQNIGGWNVSNVTDMYRMFYNADDFNQDISGWNVSLVENMEGMFFNADAFNANIGGWNVSNVTNMDSMFRSADNFNQNIGGWDTDLVADMDYMFNNAFVFNQDLSGWCVSLIGSAPTNFDSGASAWTGAPGTRPQWGTCP